MCRSGQRSADLQSGQSRNDLHGGATGFYSQKIIQQTVTEDTKDGGTVTIHGDGSSGLWDSNERHWVQTRLCWQ